MHDDFSVNYERVTEQAEHLAKFGVRGVFVGGTTGECQSLTTGEYGNGAVMSFADGRAERWGWQSTHPFMRGKPRDEAIPDLRRIQRHLTNQPTPIP